MALFQPTNVIPSSIIGQGTVDVQQNMEISWQVNGNSAMTAFQIYFYQNDTASTYVANTAKIDTYSFQNESGETLSLPFYGTDRFGNPQFFTYNADGQSWEGWSKFQLTNGNAYKFRIAQWYPYSDIAVGSYSASRFTGNIFYFKLPNENNYCVFTLDNILSVSGTIPVTINFYYDYARSIGWHNFSVFDGNNFDTVTIVDSKPSGGIDMGEATITNENYLVSPEYSFITRSTPTLSLSTTASDFITDKTALNTGDDLSTSIGYFVADYVQAQQDPIRWIRWQIAQATYNTQTKQWVLGEILQDTGDIYTPTLNFEFNGFFNGQQYAIRCFGESESGQSTILQGENSDGWVFFNIAIENPGQYSGNLTAQCLNKENAVLLEWEGVEVISPEISPADYEPTISNGSVTLKAKDEDTEYSITWNNKGKNKQGDDIPISFPAPWTAAIKLQWTETPNATTITFGGNATTFSETESTEIFGRSTVATEKGYMYQATYSFQDGMSKITSINISGDSFVTASEYTIDEQNRRYTIILYSSSPARVSANVRINYEYYKIQSQQQAPSKITSYYVSYASNDILYYDISYDYDIITSVIYTKDLASSPQLSLNVSYVEPSLGEMFEAQDNNNNSVTINLTGNSVIVKFNESNLLTAQPPNNVDSLTVIITQTVAYAYFYYDEQLSKQISNAITLNDWQFALSSVSIYGGDNGSIFNSVSVYQGDGSTIIPFYQENPFFEPVWNEAKYSLYMTANFNGNLEGGTGTADGNGFRIYRQEIGASVLTAIATFPSTTTSLKDYGIVSRKAYKYLLYAYDINGAFMSEVETENAVATCFKNFSLLVCDYDKENDAYHVRKQYLFALNLADGSVGNNNSPTLNANFTQYPTRMPSTQNYASGTLSGLIGAIYTVPALIEQIGQYKYTAKPSTLDYFDSVDLEQELYDLSVAPYQLFLRDMKGRLRMIATSAPITMTTNLKQKQQSITISLPWVEVGDASDVTIIQTPDDYGWNNDKQVLNVQLDVDVATGELSAQYPFPYNGTKFYLTGVNKETLTAKTPLGITPAQFELSNTAEQPNDGQLNATIKVNSEGNK